MKDLINRKGSIAEKLLLVSLLVVFHGNCFGQDFKKDYLKWQETFKDLHSFYADMEITIYNNYSTKSVLQVRKASVAKKEEKFRTKIDDIEVIYSDSLSLMVNHKLKAMTLGSYFPDSIDFSQQFVGIDSLLEKLENVKYSGIQEGLKTYELDYSGKLIDKTIVCFNPDDYIMRKVVYFYNKKLNKNAMVVEIELENQQINSELSEDFFNLNKYLKVKSGILIPSNEFSTYNLLYDKKK